jgi:hypothetical protein
MRFGDGKWSELPIEPMANLFCKKSKRHGTSSRDLKASERSPTLRPARNLSLDRCFVLRIRSSLAKSGSCAGLHPSCPAT